MNLGKHTRRTGDTLTYGFWLVFGRDGGVRLVRGEPGQSAAERAVKVEGSLPLALWRTPLLRATMTVHAGETRDVIESRIDVLADQVREVLGVEVEMRVVPPEGGA